MRTTFAALGIRNYRLYATGGLISNIGTWMQRVAQDWLILALTGSAGALGLTTGLQFLPIVLFSPFAGMVADRYSKRRVLALTQVALGVSAGLLGLLAITGWVQPWHVYVIAFVFGIGAAFDTPARQAFVNEMVDQPRLANAIGLGSASFNLARMIGPAVAGLLIAWMGEGVGATGWVILVNAASYGAVIWSLARMRSDELRPVQRLPRGPGQLRDGLRYVRQRPDMLLVLAIVFCAGTFGLNFQMTTALMATEVYGKGAGEYGILGSILAVGSLGGSLLAARRETPHLAPGDRRRRRVRRHGDDGGTDAQLPHVCARAAAVRVQRPHDDHHRERLHADGGGAAVAGTGHGALSRRVHGRHADRGAAARSGGRALRRPLATDRRRDADAGRQPAGRCGVRPTAGHRRQASRLAPPERRRGPPRG